MTVHTRRFIFQKCFEVQDPKNKNCERKCGQRCQGASYLVGRKHIKQCGKYLKDNYGYRSKKEIKEGLECFIEAAFGEEKDRDFMYKVLNWRETAKEVGRQKDSDLKLILRKIFPGNEWKKVKDIVSENISICGSHKYAVDFESIRWLISLGEIACTIYQKVTNHLQGKKEEDTGPFEKYMDSAFVKESKEFQELKSNKEQDDYGKKILALHDKNLQYYAIYTAYAEYQSNVDREKTKEEEILAKIEEFKIN